MKTFKFLVILIRIAYAIKIDVNSIMLSVSLIIDYIENEYDSTYHSLKVIINILLLINLEDIKINVTMIR